MAWYDTFSIFYDAAVGGIYQPFRAVAADALQLQPGEVVLDAPCGTGLSFEALRNGVGDSGVIVGADLSKGMLGKATALAKKREWANVHGVLADVHAVNDELIEQAVGKAVQVDKLLIFLGMSTFPRHDDAFANLWGLIRPGGRAVIVGVYGEKMTLNRRSVQLTARADLSRRSWESLEQRCEGFERRTLSNDAVHGGELYLATGTKA